jgi:hypothetical protein
MYRDRTMQAEYDETDDANTVVVDPKAPSEY